MPIKVPRGTKDILPEEVGVWQYLEETFREVCSLFGYQEIKTPIFEEAALFVRGVGRDTDIVSKEMYNFKDKGDRELSLRPEGTAPIIRAYVEHSLYKKTPLLKLYYLGPMFRYDRPQAGRWRQFHHLGVEAIGSSQPALDGEVIALALYFLKRLKIKELELQLNSVGCPTCREAYQKDLQKCLKDKLPLLCSDCQNRFSNNPLRVLDCKKEPCQEVVKSIPPVLDYLCQDCQEHFAGVKEYLDEIKIKYTLNPHLVRGLDYYTRTAFEITSTHLGAQNALGGGGRYDGLVETCGGPSIPAVGMALGVERIIIALQEERIELPLKKKEETFIATVREEAKKEGFKLLSQLRAAGFAADLDYRPSSLKAQMRQGDKKGARFVIIIGEEELKRGVVSLRDLRQGKQEEIKKEEIIKVLKDRREL